MKDIPIVILNKDRLGPLKLLVESLHQRNYDNIIIIDNKSTYTPLLSWYNESGLNVFYNDIPNTLYDTGTFYRLAMEIKHPIFKPIVEGFYVFTDSDVVPNENAPDDFIEHMVEVCEEFKIHKVGMGLKIDDLPNTVSGNMGVRMEKSYWEKRIPHLKYELYHAGVDTTFAVYHPNTPPLLNMNVIRMGGKYVARHIPWYYDINNLPEDELHYITNLEPNKGPTYSMNIKNMMME